MHDVARGGDGIISLALDDLGVLPLQKELLVCSNIMEDVFDNEKVKERRYAFAGAYLHRPTMLSLWSMNLWMECPQDHSTLGALDGKEGGEKYGVMDGDLL